ncbi:choice-of-anchor J domain-containing protein [Flaviaesturariibacter terrae]
MKKNILIGTATFAALATLMLSCVKDAKPAAEGLPSGFVPGSFTEEFDSVGNLAGKGWVIINRSEPMGAQGWRQGRYEPATGVQNKFAGPVPYLGFPAHSASKTPNDFVSADVSVVAGTGNISAWLISPVLPMKNGDKISFWTRAVDDSNFPVDPLSGDPATPTRDRMQVRANFTDGSANVGGDASSVGSFTNLLLDINPTYVENYPSGYPEAWTKYTVTISGIPNGVTSTGRFAFRYVGSSAGLQGPNYASVVGIDQLVFTHQN